MLEEGLFVPTFDGRTYPYAWINSMKRNSIKVTSRVPSHGSTSKRSAFYDGSEELFRTVLRNSIMQTSVLIWKSASLNPTWSAFKTTVIRRFGPCVTPSPHDVVSRLKQKSTE